MNASYFPKVDLVNPAIGAPISNGRPMALANFGNVADGCRVSTTPGTSARSACDDTASHTYLACEENWHGYRGQTTAPCEDVKRDRLAARVGDYYRWWEFDASEDVANSPA